LVIYAGPCTTVAVRIEQWY